MESFSNLEIFEQKLGICFNNKNLLKAALKHPSYAFREKPSLFERLEFLGDRVLSLVIAEILYRLFPKAEEGVLSQRQTLLVRKEFLAQKGIEWGIPSVLKVSKTHQGETTLSQNMIADAVEALLGAFYLDQGLDNTKIFIQISWKLTSNTFNEEDIKDAKSKLQEWTQSHGCGLPSYRLHDRSGLDHAPTFIVEAHIVYQKKDYAAHGKGSSRKIAEQEAAAQLLSLLNS